jgi:hypothetical protein
LPKKLDRRTFLSALSASALGAGVLGATEASALGPRSEVGIAQLKWGDGWDSRPEALRRLLWESKKRTSLNVARDATPLSLSNDDVFFQPLLVLMGEGGLPALGPEEKARLIRHLRFGGMLWVDAPSDDDGFARDAKAQLDTLLPGQILEPLPDDHVVFKSFFLSKGAVGRSKKPADVLALNVGDRAAVLFTRCDALGAFERDRFGTWRYECVPDGERQRERAIRFGVNVLMYATCLDYKADQVHIPFIMKKSRR